MDRELLDDVPNVLHSTVRSAILKSQHYINGMVVRDDKVYEKIHVDKVNDDKVHMKSVHDINARIIEVKKKLKAADELLEYAVKTNTCVGNMMQIHARQTVKYTNQIKSLEWVIKQSTKVDYDREGCLSYPGLVVGVERSVSIEVEYMDSKGKKVNMSATGLLARCIQHEVDHLNGITLADIIGE